MLKFLRKPYPFNTDPIHNAKITFFISIVFGLILFFFQPFNMIELSIGSKLKVCFFVAVITFAVLSFHLLVLPSYLNRFFTNDKWNIFKEILWNTWLLSALAVAFYFYFKYLNISILSGIDFLKIILIGVLPITILVFLNQNRLLKLNLSDAIELNRKILAKINSPDNIVVFESEYKNDTISLTANSIYLIKSAANYIEIFWKEKNKINKHLVRTKLLNAENLLKSYNFIFKCHRTYLVNTNYIEKAEGNSQGLKLFLQNIDFPIPVSRTYITKLKDLI